MIVSKTIEEMLNEIDFLQWTRYNILIPEECMDTFKVSKFMDGASFYTPPDCYVNKISEETGVKESIIEEIFLNSFEKGNHSQTYLPVSVKTFKGSKGNVLRVRDSGNGFDLNDTLNKHNEGKIYFQRYGLGFKYINKDTHHHISYEDDNSIVNVQKFHE